ncbi:helix-turn-helix domain-containing protein [Pseudovibrio sp. WM33]|uniref:helix-turn-helix domain-containing protein n=1 Tax=Pseudovibrio sp. WM33 TaxID=1735585 RepID=UPI0007AE6E55|nr:helix-turn-helix transcriptional regulator [Pseudovibrio sp. WM33]KZL23325.1 helix-turn-helix protein [Pseudovibrio sp. WM33]
MPSITVIKALKKLGSDINIARRKRKLACSDFAERIGVSRATVSRLERGDPGVKIETLVGALHVLGEIEKISNLLDVSRDTTGMLLDLQRLPKRISSEKSRARARTDGPIDPKGIAF